MVFLSSAGEEPNLVDVLATFPDSGRPLLAYLDALMLGESPYTPAERALMAAYVSGINFSQYCHGLFDAVAVAHGAEEGLVADLLTDLETADISARFRAVLVYIDKLTREPEGITETDARAFTDAGWDDAALYHAVSVCGAANLVNRLVEGLGVATDPEHLENLAARVRDAGYASLVGPQAGSGPEVRDTGG